jgi:hypothetical protein
MYGLSAKLFCINADNAANNKTMAIEISRHLEAFIASQNLLGCAGHQFNLAAQAALKALEYQSEPLISANITFVIFSSFIDAALARP